jgi:hypothetical protein
MRRQSPEQNPSDGASGDSAISGCLCLHQQVDLHLCRDDDQERDEGAEEKQSRYRRARGPISNTAHWAISSSALT